MILAWMAGTATATVHLVDPSGQCASAGFDVADAVAAAADGDTIALVEGTHQVSGLTIPGPYQSFQTLGLHFVTARPWPNCDVTPLAGHATMEGTASDRIMLIDDSIVDFDDIRFSTGAADEGGLMVLTDSFVTFDDAHFRFGTALAQGGAISANNCNLVFEGGDTVFSDNAAAGAGAIWSANTTLSVVGGARFEGNTSTEGAGVIVVFDGQATFDANISSIEIIGNTGDSEGGALWVGHGAAVRLDANSGSIVVTDNQAGAGGAFWVEEGATVEVDAADGEVTIARNSATGDGGAFHVDASSVELAGGLGSLFMADNEAQRGGAFWVDHGGSVLVGAGGGEVTLTDNVAVGDGGAFRLQGGSTLDLDAEDGTLALSYNLAGDDGGVVAVNDGEVRLRAGTGSIELSENEAVEDGGALWVSESVLEIDAEAGEIAFELHSAGDDGAAVWARDTTSALLVDGADFIGNRAGGDGGGLYLEYTSEEDTAAVTFIGVNAALNRATKGGFLWLDHSVDAEALFTVDQGDFSDNEAVDDGGAMFLRTGGAAGIDGCNFSENIARHERGGAIWVEGNVLIESSDLQSNTAGGDGGAIFVASGPFHTFTAETCTIEMNVAGENGGGLAAIDVNEVALTDVSLGGNTAVNGGGAFVRDVVNVLITEGTEIVDNDASQSGGGLYADTIEVLGHLEVSDSSVTGNEAANLGGGMYVERQLAAILTNLRLNLNVASFGGGALFDTAGLTMDIGSPCNPYTVGAPATFCSEVRDNVGTGIALVGTFAEIHRTGFADNEVSGALAGTGAALDVDSGSDVEVTNSVLFENSESYHHPAAKVVGGDLRFYSSTIARNGGRGVYWAGASSAGTLHQSIDQYNALASKIDAGSSVAIACTNRVPPTGTPAVSVHNQDAVTDLFVDELHNDYRLKAGSPSVDKCNPSLYDNQRPDFFGYSPPAYDWYDQGAVEQP